MLRSRCGILAPEPVHRARPRWRGRLPTPDPLRPQTVRGRHRCDENARTRVRAQRAGCPVRRRQRRIESSRGRPHRPRAARARRRARCARSRCGLKFRSACASRSGSARSDPLGTRPSSKRRSAVSVTPSQRSTTNARMSIESTWRKVCSDCASTSRSSTSRVIRVIFGPYEPFDPMDIPLRRVALRAQHLELSADHCEWRAQLV